MPTPTYNDVVEALRALLNVAEADLNWNPNPHPHRVMVVEAARDVIKTHDEQSKLES